MSQQKQVRDWMKAFGQDCPDKPVETLDEKTCDLRLKLIEEEFRELRDAMDEDNIVEVADAVADLLYVVHGTAVAFGLDGDAIFQAVHENNMAKLWTEHEAQGARLGQLVGTQWQDFDNKYEVQAVREGGWNERRLVVRRKDGKVMKPPTWTPPDLERFTKGSHE